MTFSAVYSSIFLKLEITVSKKKTIVVNLMDFSAVYSSIFSKIETTVKLQKGHALVTEIQGGGGG